MERATCCKAINSDAGYEIAAHSPSLPLTLSLCPHSNQLFVCQRQPISHESHNFHNFSHETRNDIKIFNKFMTII